MQILGMITGITLIRSPALPAPVELRAGQFCLLPAAIESAAIVASAGSQFLQIRAA
jgi:hypothetical protein